MGAAQGTQGDDWLTVNVWTPGPPRAWAASSTPVTDWTYRSSSATWTAGSLVQVYDAQPKVARYPEETSRLVWQHHTFAALTPLSSSSGSTPRLAPYPGVT